MTEELMSYDPEMAAQQIYHLRRAGKSFEAIRLELQGFDWFLSLSQVVSLFRSFQKSLTEAYGPDDRAQLLALELERLDELQASWWRAATTIPIDDDPDHIRVPNDKAAAMVLNVMRTRHKLLGLDIPDGTDKNVQQTVLIIGEDKRSFMEALEQGKVTGRNPRSILAGQSPDDEDVAEEES